MPHSTPGGHTRIALWGQSRRDSAGGPGTGDFDRLIGHSPGVQDDCPATFPVEERDDRVWVGIPEASPRERTVSATVV